MNAFLTGFKFGIADGMCRNFFGFSPFIANFYGFGCGCSIFSPFMQLSAFKPMGLFTYSSFFNNPYQNLSFMNASYYQFEQPQFNMDFNFRPSSNFAFDTFTRSTSSDEVKAELEPEAETEVAEKKPSKIKEKIQKIKEKRADKKAAKEKENAEKSAVAAKHYSKMSDAEMRSVYGEYNRDITTKFNGSAKDLDKTLKGKLAGKGAAFINAADKYGLNAAILAAICMNESANGSSKLAKTKNNVGGVRIPGKTEFKAYNNVEECIEDMARFLKSGYVDQGLTKLYQINAKYCPASDPTDKSGNNSKWARAVDKYSKQLAA